MKRSQIIPIMSVFLGFIGVFFLLNLFTPAKEFSQQENRYLQQRPSFSLKSLFAGDFTSDFEAYTTDQFPFRDRWTTLKARCELLTGKKENNGVYYCADNTLIKRFTAPGDAVIEENISYLNSFIHDVTAPVYFALIPGASEIRSDELPQNAVCDSEQAVIGLAYSMSEAVNVDMTSPLSAHSDEYIFYRTDHHWTSLGAYYGFTALCGALELESPPLSSYQRSVVSEDFYGTVYSSSGFSWVRPDSMETFVPDDGTAIIMNFNTSTPTQTALYDTSRLTTKDKYSMFLGGNTPRLVIDTGTDGKGKLLIIRDSYTDSLLPFLLNSYSEIHVLDLRYYKNSVKLYANEGDFDAVLVMYSVENFSTDTNIFMLSM